LKTKELKELLSRAFIDKADFEDLLEENPPSPEDPLFLDHLTTAASAHTPVIPLEKRIKPIGGLLEEEMPR
jgi:hypothetical protein